MFPTTTIHPCQTCTEVHQAKIVVHFVRSSAETLSLPQFSKMVGHYDQREYLLNVEDQHTISFKSPLRGDIVQ